MPLEHTRYKQVTKVIRVSAIEIETQKLAMQCPRHLSLAQKKGMTS